MELNKRTLIDETRGPNTMKTGNNGDPALSGKQQAHKTRPDEQSKGNGSMEKKRIVIIGD